MSALPTDGAASLSSLDAASPLGSSWAQPAGSGGPSLPSLPSSLVQLSLHPGGAALPPQVAQAQFDAALQQVLASGVAAAQGGAAQQEAPGMLVGAEATPAPQLQSGEDEALAAHRDKVRRVTAGWVRQTVGAEEAGVLRHWLPLLSDLLRDTGQEVALPATSAQVRCQRLDMLQGHAADLFICPGSIRFDFRQAE
ncbi:hypothetical protein HaLaN_17601 [Haematococcus lacustris]|uniref:Uncharacterized protein n=1 Tax=Haematococcus lacustris TaxID=44745 RepID=A0A699ZP10_HAELA|nr:hypothetical protein HaLaN_17601 [Haematococcus lacustris]